MISRLGWELALLRREWISEQHADWSVSEKNNLNKQTGYQGLVRSSSLDICWCNSTTMIETLSGPYQSSVQWHVTGQEDDKDQQESDLCFLLHLRLMFSKILVGNQTGTLNFKQINLPQWLIVCAEVILSGLAFPPDDVVRVPHVEAVLLPVPRVLLHGLPPLPVLGPPTLTELDLGVASIIRVLEVSQITRKPHYY